MVEHTLGKGGVASPILASGTIYSNSAFIADFFFLNKSLFSPISSLFAKALLSLLFGLFAMNLENISVLVFEILTRNYLKTNFIKIKFLYRLHSRPKGKIVYAQIDFA